MVYQSSYCRYHVVLHPIQQGTDDNKHPNHLDYGVNDSFQNKPLGYIFYQYPSDEDTNCCVYQCVNHIL